MRGPWGRLPVGRDTRRLPAVRVPRKGSLWGCIQSHTQSARRSGAERRSGTCGTSDSQDRLNARTIQGESASAPVRGRAPGSCGCAGRAAVSRVVRVLVCPCETRPGLAAQGTAQSLSVPRPLTTPPPFVSALKGPLLISESRGALGPWIIHGARAAHGPEMARSVLGGACVPM